MDKKTRDEQHTAREVLLTAATEVLTASRVDDDFDPSREPALSKFSAAFSRSVTEYLNAEKACEADDSVPTARRDAILKVLDYVAAAYLRAHPNGTPSTLKFFDVARWFTNLPTTLLSKALQIPDVPETPEINPHGGVG